MSAPIDSIAEARIALWGAMMADVLAQLSHYVVDNFFFGTLSGLFIVIIMKPVRRLAELLSAEVSEIVERHAPSIVKAGLLPAVSFAACIVLFAKIEVDDRQQIGIAMIMVMALFLAVYVLTPAIIEWRWPKRQGLQLSAGLGAALLVPAAALATHAIDLAIKPNPPRTIYVSGISTERSPAVIGTTTLDQVAGNQSLFALLRNPINAIWSPDNKVFSATRDDPAQVFDINTAMYKDSVAIDSWAETHNLPKLDYAIFPSIAGSGKIFSLNLSFFGRKDEKHQILPYSPEVRGDQWPEGFEDAAATAASIKAAQYLVDRVSRDMGEDQAQQFKSQMASIYCSELQGVLDAHKQLGVAQCADVSAASVALARVHVSVEPEIEKLLKDANKQAATEALQKCLSWGGTACAKK